MKKILIIGATGSVGTTTANYLINNHDLSLTLFARHATYLNEAKSMIGNVLKLDELNLAMHNQDIVFASLSGNLPAMARNIIHSMDINHVNRLIFISSMGIYDEIEHGGPVNNDYHSIPAILRPYRQAADIIEDSDINYTIIRPGWYNNGPVDYGITHKGEQFIGHDVSRKSIADLVNKIIINPHIYSYESIGIARQ